MSPGGPCLPSPLPRLAPCGLAEAGSSCGCWLRRRCGTDPPLAVAAAATRAPPQGPAAAPAGALCAGAGPHLPLPAQHDGPLRRRARLLDAGPHGCAAGGVSSSGWRGPARGIASSWRWRQVPAATSARPQVVGSPRPRARRPGRPVPGVAAAGVEKPECGDQLEPAARGARARQRRPAVQVGAPCRLPLHRRVPAATRCCSRVRWAQLVASCSPEAAPACSRPPLPSAVERGQCVVRLGCHIIGSSAPQHGGIRPALGCGGLQRARRGRLLAACTGAVHSQAQPPGSLSLLWAMAAEHC